MFKLTCDRFSSSRGWVMVEEFFLAGEHRTAVEVARDRLARPDTFCGVLVLDLRPVKTEVATVRPADPLAGVLAPLKTGQVTLKVPALVFVDLGKLPRKPAPKKAPVRPKTVKLLGVPVAGLDAFPDKPRRRVSKRERAFGAAGSVRS